jgi:hypothetical protein
MSLAYENTNIKTSVNIFGWDWDLVLTYCAANREWIVEANPEFDAQMFMEFGYVKEPKISEIVLDIEENYYFLPPERA